MLPAPASSDPRPAAAPDAQALIDAYVAHLTATGRQGDARYRHAAERFFARWPDPASWAAEPLSVRRRARGRTRTMLTFLMLQRRLQPGYDYLLDVTLLPLWRELPASPLHEDLEHFRAASQQLGFTAAVSKGAAGLVCARLLIQTGRPLHGLTDQDIADFDQALRERQQRTGRGISHYGRALFSARSVLYHLGILSRPPSHRARSEPQSFDERLARRGVTEQMRSTMVAYLQQLGARLEASTVSGRATKLGHFGAHLARVDPGLESIAQLDRRRHIETYLTAVANATRPRDGRPISIEEQRDRIIAVSCFLNDIGQWGWPEAPADLPAGRPATATGAAALPARRDRPPPRRGVGGLKRDARRQRAPACPPHRPADRRARRSRA
jgi:hypothetical protein